MSLSSMPPEPWHSFLAEIDAALDGPVHLNCIGGFALTVHYGMSRPTADIDLIEVPAAASAGPLLTLGSQGGPLHRKYGLYIDPVTVASFPENYEDRLTDIFVGAYENLRVRVLEASQKPSEVRERWRGERRWFRPGDVHWKSS